MKLPIVLRKTHKTALERATNIITEKNRVIAVKKDELAVERKINDTNREKINKLQEENNILKSNLEELKIKFKELDADNIKLINLFNTANRANWCNNESSRQLKKLAEKILESDKIHKADLASYLLNISKYVGGGIPKELKVIDDIEK